MFIKLSVLQWPQGSQRSRTKSSKGIARCITRTAHGSTTPYKCVGRVAGGIITVPTCATIPRFAQAVILLRTPSPMGSLISRPLTRYALRSRGPRKNQRIRPSTGSSSTAIIQISFFSFEAELWKILIIAQISPISIRRPKTPLYPKLIILVPSLFSGSCQSLTPVTCAP